ncbi:MAG: aminotransferase class I/II-fold pyridoxal phosphate-dependent enzyme [Candidatus Brocadiae bacterium]|nr:aminotransferase class I/II-fold pyridoxal phosphate-dependent enzyme [Candidatus Brocadiia bacterium]
MSLEKLEKTLNTHIDDLTAKGIRKGFEMVITGIKPAGNNQGPRYYIEGKGQQEFIKMNANSYLGLSLRHELIEAEEEGVRKYGVGPGAVRFISGTHKPHVDLEKKLASFHSREAAMLFSSAYVTSMGVLVPLITEETVVVSDALNHNCIINAMKLARPAAKAVYRHNDMKEMEAAIQNNIGKGKRAVVVTDGIFSMRGDHAPLKELVEICNKYQESFPEGVITVADDSHGVGAFGKTGRGTEEYTNAKVDVLVGTLGKAFGVNGGYVVSSKTIIAYLKETAPMYIYSNPITVGECYAAIKALEILEGKEGATILEHLRKVTKQFRDGLKKAGYETLEGEHPVVPLMVRDTAKTKSLVEYLVGKGILATGLNYPVVPKGDEEIRFQISASHTQSDISYVLDVLAAYK